MVNLFFTAFLCTLSTSLGIQFWSALLFRHVWMVWVVDFVFFYRLLNWWLNTYSFNHLWFLYLFTWVIVENKLFFCLKSLELRWAFDHLLGNIFLKCIGLSWLLTSLTFLWNRLASLNVTAIFHPNDLIFIIQIHLRLGVLYTGEHSFIFWDKSFFFNLLQLFFSWHQAICWPFALLLVSREAIIYGFTWLFAAL